MTTLFLGIEDELSESIARKIIISELGDIVITPMRKGGFGYLRTNIPNFCQIAQRSLVVVVTDLDRVECAPAFVRDWTQNHVIPDRMLLRVAVREVEAWLLADRKNFSNFLGVAQNTIPMDVEETNDPKSLLVQLAKRSRKRKIRDELTPRRGVRASQGLGYNETLSQFVMSRWDIEAAAENCNSLRKTIFRVRELQQFVQ